MFEHHYLYGKCLYNSMRHLQCLVINQALNFHRIHFDHLLSVTCLMKVQVVLNVLLCNNKFCVSFSINPSALTLVAAVDLEKVKSPSPLVGFWENTTPSFVPLGIKTKLALSYVPHLIKLLVRYTRYQLMPLGIL
jgi:hypothetical protein